MIIGAQELDEFLIGHIRRCGRSVPGGGPAAVRPPLLPIRRHRAPASIFRRGQRLSHPRRQVPNSRPSPPSCKIRCRPAASPWHRPDTLLAGSDQVQILEVRLGCPPTSRRDVPERGGEPKREREHRGGRHAGRRRQERHARDTKRGGPTGRRSERGMARLREPRARAPCRGPRRSLETVPGCAPRVPVAAPLPCAQLITRPRPIARAACAPRASNASSRCLPSSPSRSRVSATSKPSKLRSMNASRWRAGKPRSDASSFCIASILHQLLGHRGRRIRDAVERILRLVVRILLRARQPRHEALAHAAAALQIPNAVLQDAIEQRPPLRARSCRRNCARASASRLAPRPAHHRDRAARPAPCETRDARSRPEIYRVLASAPEPLPQVLARDHPIPSKLHVSVSKRGIHVLLTSTDRVHSGYKRLRARAVDAWLMQDQRLTHIGCDRRCNICQRHFDCEMQRML